MPSHEIRLMSFLHKILFLTLLPAQLFGQESFSRKTPSVSMSPVSIPSIKRGQATILPLQFHVGSGFHINSNTPKQDYLIPTSLKLDPPTSIVIGRIEYPSGTDSSFSFAPDEKLSVYTGSFKVGVTVRPLASILPGKYAIRGELKYQACDNAACYPPKRLPVDFEVKVVRGAETSRKNPAQSPNIHR